MFGTVKNVLIKNFCAKSLLTVIMVVVLITTTLASPMSAFSKENAPVITYFGEEISQIVIDSDEKINLKAEQFIWNDAGYGWQIEDPENEGRFVNIANAYSNRLSVSYALIGDMLKGDGSANIRCCVSNGEEKVYTECVNVKVSFKVPESTRMLMTAPFMNAAAVAETEGEGNTDQELKTYSIVINYLFDNGGMAFEPYGALVAAGSSFLNKQVESPKVVGYKPVIRDGSNYYDASVVTLNYEKVNQNYTINVIYEPDLVEFSVHHHFQNILDDEYSLTYDRITKGQALTGSLVGEGLAYTPEQLPGFNALAYEKLTVAADGSTVIEIRYDRNYYLIDFDMNGGYGTEPVYTRYGATVGANTPIRHGYVFDGWELVSYGGQTPTLEQQSQLDINGKTITVPAASLTYRAKWITQQTTYTMVFWRENADDNGYSYWGYLDNLTAMSGDYVNGEDYIRRVANISDEDYFTFNPQKTDKNVLVEGDGSTVVNVYYTRNYYTITFRATNVACAIPVNHTHGDSCYDVICGMGHTHTADCNPNLICTITEHLAHTDKCIVCGKEAHTHGGVGCDCNLEEHTHVKACWSGAGNSANPRKAPSNPEQGEIYRRNKNYYIYLFGAWYNYSAVAASDGDVVLPDCGYKVEHTHGADCACDKEEHTHSDDCIKDELHTHGEACYEYSCNVEGHIHKDNCYRLKCGITVGHTHKSSCDASTRNTNTIKTVTRKYQQSITDIWPVTDGHGNVYDDGQRWKPGGSDYYSQVLVYLSKMVPQSFTLTLDVSEYTPYIMNYYLQVLDGDPYTHTYNGKNYILNNTVKASYNYVTKAEDFFDISGFTQYASNPAFYNNQINIDRGDMNVHFYYNRKIGQVLEFNNNGEILDDKTVKNVMFGASLKNFNFTPPYPNNLEPNAYAFAGWYTSPGCFKGTEVNWQTATMAEDNMMYYAKWAPITHTVKVFKDASLSEQIGQTQVVDHNAFADAPDSANVTNGNLVFLGWFYTDVVSGVETEKAFVFTGIPIIEDMNIYAKWGSHVSVNYKINYVLKSNGEKIADSTEGSAIAGHNKTFEAKAGNDLYPGYTTGFYPLTNSHTVTMSAERDHEYTFEYVYVESMPYTVEYVNAKTGEKLLPDKVVENNTYSVVTETFQRISGMMPDAYQKRLVLSASGEENKITFYYTADEVHAYYRVVHHIQSLDGKTYREYRSEDIVGVIGESYAVEALTLTGFNYNKGITKVNNVLTPQDNERTTFTLDNEGMLIEMYYDRILVDYTVKYLLYGTDKKVAEDKVASGLYGQQIVETAKDLTSSGYVKTGAEVKNINLSTNAEHNLIEFYYQEDTVAIKYVLVGPSGCGLISYESENVAAVTGNARGSTPTVFDGFEFIGWFADPNCTIAVPTEWVSSNNELIPRKQAAVWKDATYYAKFIALETDLIIHSTGSYGIDGDQAFLYRVKGTGANTKGVDVYVSIIGDGYATIADLPLGEYTVTELTDWSWRYSNITPEREIVLDYNNGSNTILFANTRSNEWWLDGNAYKTNNF